MHKLTRFALRTHKVGILHEDDDIIVLDKPSGLLVIPDRFDPDVPNLLSIFRSGGDDVLVVHRLDKDTTGCIVVARTPDAHRSLNEQFEAHTVGKRYTAICSGSVGEESGTIDLPIGEDRRRHAMKVDRKHGKPSSTRFTVEERFRGYTWVGAEPTTGRTHQIRVHLQALGNPIVCDPLYGDGKPFFLSSTKRRYKRGKEAEKPLLSRTALHAVSVRFRHPRSGAEVTIEAPMPKDMRSVIRMLRKYAPPGPEPQSL